MSRPAVLLPSDNLAAAATVTLGAGAESSSHPLANINNGDVTHPFIADAAAAVRIVFDCASAVRVDGFFMPMCNIPAGTAFNVEGHTSNTWGAPDVQVALTMPTYVSLGPDLDPIPESFGVDLRSLYSAGGRTKRWWSLVVASFASPLAIGELLFGELTDLKGFSPDANQYRRQYPAVVKQAAFGNRWAFRYPLRQQALGGTAIVTDATRELFQALEAEVGGGADPFIYMPDPDDNIGLLVTLESAIEGAGVTPDVHQLQLSLLEVGRGLPL